MTPAGATLPGELLQNQGPGCAWLLNRAGGFHAVFGDAPRLLGRSRAALEGLRFIELFSEEARPAWSARLERVFAGETVNAVVRFDEDGGSHYSITMFPVESHPGEIALAGCVTHEMPAFSALLSTFERLETERGRLARLLHDNVAQVLSATGLQLDLLRMDLADRGTAVPKRIGEIQNGLETLMGMVRELNRDLNTTSAERMGLRAALDELAGELRTKFQGNVRLFADGRAQPLPAVATAMYRIAQEATAIAVRRPGCSLIEILVKPLGRGSALEIRADGASPRPEDRSWQAGGLEFLAMHHFARRAGMELEIESGPDKGTVVRALSRSEEGLARKVAGD